MPRSSIRTHTRAEPPDAEPAPGPCPSPDPRRDPSAWSALEALYRRNAGWLVTALRRRFGHESAEELSQEAFLRSRSYGENDLRHPRSLLLSVATNAAREAQRRQRVRAPDAAGGVELAPESLWSPADQELQILLKQIVMGLPPKLREVFVLSRFEGLTYPEIAQRCGISVKTVEWRMTKALDICSARLRD